MNHFISLSHIRRIMAVLLASLLLVSLTTNIASAGYPKKVLVEDFTNVYCGPCNSAEPYLQNALNNYVEHEEYIFTAIHTNWPGPSDPWYVANSGENQSRWTYYNVRGVPTYTVNGVVAAWQSYAGVEAAVSNAIAAQLETESPLMIEVIPRVHDDNLTTIVHVTSAEELSNLRLFIFVGEQVYEYRAPNGMNEHHGPMLDFIPDANGTAFDIDAEETVDFEFQSSLSFAGIRNHHAIDQDNLFITAWVQASNREILQAEYNDFQVDGPMLTIESVTTNDSEGGNNDGRAEGGESVQVYLNVSNDPDFLTAESVDIVMSTAVDGIQITQNFWSFDNLSNGAQINNENDPFVFTVAEDFVPDMVDFTFTIDAMPGEIHEEITASVKVGWPDMLIVDASRSADAAMIVQSYLNSEEMPWAETFDRVTEGVLPDGYTTHFNTIFWHSFNAQDNILTPNDEANLRAFLARGGNLVMTGTYLLINHSNYALFSEVLNISLDEESIRSSFVDGIENDRHFGGAQVYLGGGDAGAPPVKPSISMGEGVQPVMYYRNFENKIAAAKIENGQSRALIFSIPIETIAGRLDTELFAPFMGRIVNWINNGPESIGDEGTVNPTVFALNAAYPNPFNATTVVPFSLEKAGFASLKLFDLNGREISTLLQGNLTAGSHTAVFVAPLNGMTSGMYYLRLSSGEHVQGQKVLYLR